ncbi:MAG: serine/threonine-protein kinase [Bryobacterales bacterium]|nr:serine/threonine-protein kinase [Bryobacterales bacterium]
MGEVWKARDTRIDRIVAMKFSQEKFSERFEREARAIGALSHTNICTLYDVGPNYLVMEYVEGSQLKGPLPIDEALRYAAQICAALDHAHKKGFTHRDLKPANIMVTKAGIKLLDFGLAKLSAAAQAPKPGLSSKEDATLTMALTGKNEIVGTLYYMSPEQLQAQANGQEIDGRSDIFSFGIVLYEMLTGKRAFEGTSPASVIAAIMERPAPSIADIAPPALDRLLKTCLAKDPDERWQSARDVKRELEWIASGSSEAVARTAPSPSRFGRLTGIAAAVLAIGLVWLSWVAWRATRPVEQPLTRFSVDLGPEAVAGRRITAAISPDGRRLAFVARGAGGKEQLATRLLDQANPTFLAGTENASDPFFSPDSQWIGFFADGKMKKIPVAGGAALTLCDAPDARGASWGEDGNIVVTLIAASGTGLFRVAAAGGTPQTLTKPGDKNEASHRWPQILPGGEAVLFTSTTVNGAYDDGSIQVLSLKTGQWKTVQRGGYFGRYLATSNRAGQLVYVHQGTLLAVPFDLDRLEVRGTPSPLLEDVAGDPLTGGGQFDVSRNGTFVYLGGKSSAAGWPLVWLDSTGKTEPLLASPGPYFTPRLSPDGKRLAVSLSVNAIEVYDSQRGTMTPLTFKPQFALYPVWTPDGKHIVFAAAAGPTSTLQWIRSDGAGEPQPLLEGKTELRPYSFSPDGKRLAFGESRAETGYDLWTLPLDLSDPEHPKAGKPELFLRTMADEYEPAFSPDGRWIAYQSFATGASEVYVQPFPGPGGKWLISTGGGRHPIWSRNGRELFYQAQDFRIMVVTYSAKGDSFAADKARPWAETQILAPNALYWNLDLAPDGKRFVVAPRREATGGQKGSVHVTVLLNFFDQLRRKVPTGK